MGEDMSEDKVIDFKGNFSGTMPKQGVMPDSGEVIADAVEHVLDLKEDQQAEVQEMVEMMKRAEDAVRQTMHGLSIIAGIQVEPAKHEPDEVATEGPRYIGELTMIGYDGSLFGQTIIGPEIKRREGDPEDQPIDSRRQLAEMLRELANAIYDNIEEHP